MIKVYTVFFFLFLSFIFVSEATNTLHGHLQLLLLLLLIHPPVCSTWCILTSVPYLASAAFACWRIFSLYIWAARLLYLALVSLVEQPCWRKKAVFRAEGDATLLIHATASPQSEKELVY